MRTDDSAQAMREWRWRAYRDHLEDLGYELDGGAGHDDHGDVAERTAVAVTAVSPTHAVDADVRR